MKTDIQGKAVDLDCILLRFVKAWIKCDETLYNYKRRKKGRMRKEKKRKRAGMREALRDDTKGRKGNKIEGKMRNSPLSGCIRIRWR